jgi:hypothetical protein
VTRPVTARSAIPAGQPADLHTRPGSHLRNAGEPDTGFVQHAEQTPPGSWPYLEPTIARQTSVIRWAGRQVSPFQDAERQGSSWCLPLRRAVRAFMAGQRPRFFAVLVCDGCPWPTTTSRTCTAGSSQSSRTARAAVFSCGRDDALTSNPSRSGEVAVQRLPCQRYSTVRLRSPRTSSAGWNPTLACSQVSGLSLPDSDMTSTTSMMPEAVP